jgi:hypothetical protein
MENLSGLFRYCKSYNLFVIIVLITISSCSFFQKAEQSSVLNITDFGIKPGTGENAIFAVQKVIEKAKSIDSEVLIKFPVGRYDFRIDSSHVKTYFESNTTDNNPKNLAFLIEKCQNLIIDGGGSDFIFHGPMQAFSIDNSKNITIKNVNIDWDIPLTAQAEVISVTNKTIELKIDTLQFPYVIEDGWLYFIDKTWKQPMWKWGTMEFDVATRLVVPETGDRGCFRAIDNKYFFKEQKAGYVQMISDFTRTPAVGNYLVLRHSPRDHAGIFVWYSENILLKNINVYHAAGLGCLSQYSRDLDYRNVNFIPNPQKNRFLSAHDDGFQVSNCAGQVNIIDCEFAGLMDDPINVHGTSVRIIKKLDEHKLKCLFVHHQSEGMLWGRSGEKVAFLENESMQTVSIGKLKSFEAINTSEFIVEFEDTVPGEITIGDALENLCWTPDLYIGNCLFGSCRARGLLVTTPGNVVIENNVFESSGSAILIAGDANYWYESGAVIDVIIRNNTFNDPCMTSMYQFCEAIISIYPEIPKLNNETPFHRNILIENNVFHPFDYPVLYAKSVENLDFINNKIIRSKRFKAFHKRKYTLSFEACKDVEVTGNKFKGDVLGKNILFENMSENEIKAQKEFQISKGI